MDIEKTYWPETDTHELRIRFTGQYLVAECDAHPYAHLIDDEQARGIIEDAVLMAYGQQLKPKPTQSSVQTPTEE